MSERGISFEKITKSDSRDIQELQGYFSGAESVPAKAVKIFAENIADSIKSKQSVEEQRIFLIDLLSEGALKKLVRSKTMFGNYSEEEKDDIEMMAKFSAKQIRKAVVEELKKYLPKELYFFIKNYITENSHNTKVLVENHKEGSDLFLKSTGDYSPDIRDNLYAALEKLKSALENIADQQTQMPFLPQLKIVGKSQKHSGTISVAVEQKNIVTIQDIFERDDKYNLSLRDKLLALTDCLKGAKFLADNGLTLTDLATREPGRNLGIDMETKKGILFDLDGLLESGKKVSTFLCAINEDKSANTSLVAPEYLATASKGEGINTDTESMIWEMGNNIYRLAERELGKLWSKGNFFSHQRMINLWEKMKDFSLKMTEEKPDQRPAFDVCINKLKEIINKYLPEN